MTNLLKTALAAGFLAAGLSQAALAQDADDDGKAAKEKMAGIYFGSSELLTFSGAFGTFTCAQLNPGEPEACTSEGSLHLRPDGTATILVDHVAPAAVPHGVWEVTGKQEVRFTSLNIIYDGDGVPERWSVGVTDIVFDKDYQTYESNTEVKRYPISEDPANPMSAPGLVIESVATATRFR